MLICNDFGVDQGDGWVERSKTEFASERASTAGVLVLLYRCFGTYDFMMRCSGGGHGGGKAASFFVFCSFT